MTFELDAPEDVGGESSFLSAPGTYHTSILDVSEGVGPKGNPISGFCVHLVVEAGTTEGQESKEINLVLFSPKLDQSDAAQAWAKRKQAAFLIAAGLMRPDQLGKRVSVDLQAAKNRQIIVELEENEYEGQVRLQIRFANIYHVDDPRAKDFPKKADVLALLPESQRVKDPAVYFEPLLKKKASTPAETRHPVLSGSDLDDL